MIHTVRPGTRRDSVITHERKAVQQYYCLCVYGESRFKAHAHSNCGTNDLCLRCDRNVSLKSLCTSVKKEKRITNCLDWQNICKSSSTVVCVLRPRSRNYFMMNAVFHRIVYLRNICRGPQRESNKCLGPMNPPNDTSPVIFINRYF